MTKRISLLLHVGLPKTGSIATQFWADGNRRQLLKVGICYPEPTQGQSKPKHQALVSELIQNSQLSLGRWIESSPAARLFLSTEGLSNHVYDFSDDALGEFRSITKGVQVVVFAVFRERTAWLRSYYKQSVITAPNPRFLYGTSLKFEDFAATPRLTRLADRQKMLERLEAAYGADSVVEADYEKDWQGCLLATLGIESSKISMSLPVSNESASDDVVELVRQYNGFSAPRRTASCFSTC